MTTADEEFRREFTRLSAAFVAELPQRVQILSDDLAAWLSAPREALMFERLSHRVHQLKGAGSTFGCNGISNAAAVLEQHLAALHSAASSASGGTAVALEEIEAAIEALRDETNRVCGESAQGGKSGARK